MMVQIEDLQDSRKIEELKQLIDDEDYVSNAIRRIAQVLSDELLGVNSLGALHERER
ncbi:hypothetical protein MASR2M78_18650 [Treponema sp.]